MKCHYENREKIIARYLAGELSEQEAEAFEAHYVDCDDCFRELQFMYDALELVSIEGNVIFKDSLKKFKWRRESRLGRCLNFLSLTPTETVKVLAIVAAVFVLVGSIFLLKNPKEENILDKIAFNEVVPYTYDPEALLRGASKDSLDFHTDFSDRFQKAMFSYKDRDYQSAIQKFEALQNSAHELETATGNSESFLLLREYYFYRGVSRFALVRDQKSELSVEKEEQLLKEAIQNLLKADEMTQTHGLKDKDEVIYFLGLAYGFYGKQELAVQYLRMVRPNNNSEIKYVPELIDKWSK